METVSLLAVFYLFFFFFSFLPCGGLRGNDDGLAHVLFRVTTNMFHFSVLCGSIIFTFPSSGFKISYSNLSISATQIFFLLACTQCDI